MSPLLVKQGGYLTKQKTNLQPSFEKKPKTSLEQNTYMQLSRLMKPLSKVEIAITVCLLAHPTPTPSIFEEFSACFKYLLCQFSI
jgi:hypothetical protein